MQKNKILFYSSGAVYMGGRTGRLPGQDVKQDLAMHVYVHLIFPIRLYERIFPAKVGQFLS